MNETSFSTYTVIEPDDDSGLTYRWHGGATVNIYLHDSLEREVGVFTLYGDDRGNPPTLAQVQEAVRRQHETAGAEDE